MGIIGSMVGIRSAQLTSRSINRRMRNNSFFGFFSSRPSEVTEVKKSLPDFTAPRTPMLYPSAEKAKFRIIYRGKSICILPINASAFSLINHYKDNGYHG